MASINILLQPVEQFSGIWCIMLHCSVDGHSNTTVRKTSSWFHFPLEKPHVVRQCITVGERKIRLIIFGGGGGRGEGGINNGRRRRVGRKPPFQLTKWPYMAGGLLGG